MPDNPVGNPREHQSQTITTTDPRVLMRGDVDATETLDKLVERLSVKPRAFNDLLPPDVLAFLFEALLQVCIDEDMAKYDRLTTVQKLPILVSYVFSYSDEMLNNVSGCFSCQRVLENRGTRHTFSLERDRSQRPNASQDARDGGFAIERTAS